MPRTNATVPCSGPDSYLLGYIDGLQTILSVCTDWSGVSLQTMVFDRPQTGPNTVLRPWSVDRLQTSWKHGLQTMVFGPSTDWSADGLETMVSGPSTDWSENGLQTIVSGPSTDWSADGLKTTVSGPSTDESENGLQTIVSGPSTD